MKKEEMIKRIENEYTFFLEGKLWVENNGEYKVKITDNTTECYAGVVENIKTVLIFRSLVEFYSYYLGNRSFSSGRITNTIVDFCLKVRYVFLKPEWNLMVCVLR